jgi:APA family basic amino acid/polyamine antiporter
MKVHTEGKQHNAWSGAGLVIANMIGVGVLLSTGFMAQDMAAIPILIAWIAGAAIALCGALAYGGVIAVIGESGGEYRLLSDLLHPFLGYLAGWGSLVLGFAAAIAVDAHAIGSFLNTLIDGPDPRLTGALVIVAFTAIHALPARFAHLGQNSLVGVKLLFLCVFVCLGLALGSNALPTWAPANPSPGFPVQKLIEHQFWIAFAFSGWNAAIYTAKEFRNPSVDVGRAMLLGLGVVTVLYLLINWIFVANITPQQAVAVFTYEETRITLAHLIALDIFGSTGGQIMSIFVIWALVSAISAMMMVGPRVYAAMAQDGYLPGLFTAESGRPPLASTVLQASVALVFLFSYSLLEAVQAAAAFLMLFSALTAVALFRVHRLHPEFSRPATYRLAAAAIYGVAVACILYTGLKTSDKLWYSLGSVLVIALVAFLLTRRLRHDEPTPP